MLRGSERCKCLVLGFQCITARLCIGPLGKSPLCAVKESLGHTKIFGRHLFGTGIFRRRYCLPRITHFLHRRRGTATGGNEQYGDQQTASGCTEKCSGFRDSCWTAHKGTLASARTVRQAAAGPLTGAAFIAKVAAPQAKLTPQET